MGAWMTQQIATGKTVADAHRSAVDSASAEYGHQEGYSGAINSGGGYAPVELPARVTFAKFLGLLEEAADLEDAGDDYFVRYYRGMVAKKQRGAKGSLAKAERDLAKAKKASARFYARVEAAGFSRYQFDGLAATFNDKWGDYLAVELRGAERARCLNGRKLRRGERVWVFFGYAPC